MPPDQIPPPPRGARNPLIPLVFVLIWIGAGVAAIELFAYGKRRTADAEAYRVRVVRAAFDGDADRAIQFEGARK